MDAAAQKQILQGDTQQVIIWKGHISGLLIISSRRNHDVLTLREYPLGTCFYPAEVV
jgi:hypothetical protein